MTVQRQPAFSRAALLLGLTLCGAAPAAAQNSRETPSAISTTLAAPPVAMAGDTSPGLTASMAAEIQAAVARYVAETQNQPAWVAERRACEGCPRRSVGRALLQTTVVNVFYELANLGRGQATARITPKT